MDEIKDTPADRGADHIRQSIQIMLAAPIGSRVKRPECGSPISKLIQARAGRKGS